MCLHQVEKNMLPVLELRGNLVYLFLTYMESLYVEMLKWHLDKERNV